MELEPAPLGPPNVAILLRHLNQQLVRVDLRQQVNLLQTPPMIPVDRPEPVPVVRPGPVETGISGGSSLDDQPTATEIVLLAVTFGDLTSNSQLPGTGMIRSVPAGRITVGGVNLLQVINEIPFELCVFGHLAGQIFLNPPELGLALGQLLLQVPDQGIPSLQSLLRLVQPALEA